jgi:hypothetical protein
MSGYSPGSYECQQQGGPNNCLDVNNGNGTSGSANGSASWTASGSGSGSGTSIPCVNNQHQLQAQPQPQMLEAFALLHSTQLATLSSQVEQLKRNNQPSNPFIQLAMVTVGAALGCVFALRVFSSQCN